MASVPSPGDTFNVCLGHFCPFTKVHFRQPTPPLIELPNHFIGAQQDRLRNRDAEGLGGLEIDHEF